MTAETVVVTASAGAFTGLIDALMDIPLLVEEHPLMNFAPPLDWGPLDGALDRIGTYGSIAFTSPRAATTFIDRIELREVPLPEPEKQPAVWAGGPSTAAALRGRLGTVDMPSAGDIGRLGAADALAKAMLENAVTSPVLFPCGDSRRDDLPTRLRNAGLMVDETVCYRSVLAGEQEARIIAARATVLVVASPSVAALVARVCPPGQRPDLLAVGPTTAAAASNAGWPPAVVAAQPSVDALADAVRAVVAGRNRSA